MKTCHKLRNIVVGSSQLQYRKELMASHRLDCYPTALDLDGQPVRRPSYNKRLWRLKQSEAAWRFLLPVKPVGIPLLLPSGPLHVREGEHVKLNRSILTKIGVGNGECEVSWMRLTSLFGSSIDTTMASGCFKLSCPIDPRRPYSWLADAGNDLLIGIAPGDVYNIGVCLYMFSLTTGAFHPAAAERKIRLPGVSSTFEIKQTAVGGNRVAMLARVTRAQASLAIIVNWRTAHSVRQQRSG